MAGKRSDSDVQIKNEFILTGKVPLKIMVRKGLRSLLADPWLTYIKYLTGPIGFKLRQIYWQRKMGKMAKGVVIDPDVDIFGSENIYLDEFSYVGKTSQLVANEGYIKIGKRCHLYSWIVGHGGVEIGNYVATGKSTILSCSDSHQGGYRMSGPMIPDQQRNLRYGKVVIEDDAFIGQWTVIMPGVTIGQGAIVGANSLVVRDVEPWTVVMGNPARMVQKRERIKFPAPD
jgi:galactoside O-acetyltransferase